MIVRFCLPKHGHVHAGVGFRCRAALNLPNVCGNEHVASTPMAGEPRRVELAGHARGSRGSAASSLGAGVSTTPGSGDRRRGDTGPTVRTRAGAEADHDRAALCDRGGLHHAGSEWSADRGAPDRRSHGGIDRTPGDDHQFEYANTTLAHVQGSERRRRWQLDRGGELPLGGIARRRRIVSYLSASRLCEHGQPLPRAVSADRQRSVEHGVPADRPAEPTRSADLTSRDSAA